MINLKERRQALGMSQFEMSEKLSVAQCSLASWELGTAWPTIDKLPGIANAYGVSLDELVPALIAAKEARAS